MKPIMFLDRDALADDTTQKEKLEAEGYVVVFIKPGAKAWAIFPAPEGNGVS